MGSQSEEKWSKREWADSGQSEEKWSDSDGQAQPKKFPKTGNKGKDKGKEGSASSSPSWETQPGLASYWNQKPKIAAKGGAKTDKGKDGTEKGSGKGDSGFSETERWLEQKWLEGGARTPGTGDSSSESGTETGKGGSTGKEGGSTETQGKGGGKGGKGGTETKGKGGKVTQETGNGGWTSSETETQGKGGTVSTDGIPNEDAVSHITAHEFLDAANLFDVGIRLEPEGLSRNIAQRAMFRIC